MKKIVIPVLLALILSISFASESFAASVGQQLTAPESGWKRFNDTDSHIAYVGEWSTYNNTNYYLGSGKLTNTKNSYAKFRFYGTKLRILGSAYHDESPSISINVDGVDYSYSLYLAPGVTYQMIAFELLDLPLGTHTVTITNTDGKYTNIDAIDVDDTGYLVAPNTPMNLIASGDNSQVTLVWDQIQNADSYIIHYGTKPGNYTETATATKAAYENFVIPGLTNGTKYYFVVSAKVNGVESEYSNEASATPYPSEVTSEVKIDIESAKDKVFLNETFTVQAVLNNATNIYAEDFNVKYDSTRFQLVKVEAADHMGLFHNGTVSDDTVRLITASLGKDYGINEKGTLVHFTFKAIGLGKGKIDATKGKIADNGTTETTLAERNFGGKEIEVIGGVGEFTDFSLKHLGFLGFNYTEHKDKLTDELKNLLGSTGNVADVDLVQLTNAILANLNYDFNK